SPVPREVRDLHLPAAGIDELPGRREEDRRLALAVALPEDADAVSLHEPFLVRGAGARLLARWGGDDHGRESRKSRMRRFTFTGSRMCGACPEPSRMTNRAPICSAMAAARVTDWIASFAPWITSTGHRTRRQSACDSSGVSPAASWVAIMVSASVSSPQPMPSSIGFVECGSVNILETKNSTQSA